MHVYVKNGECSLNKCVHLKSFTIKALFDTPKYKKTFKRLIKKHIFHSQHAHVLKFLSKKSRYLHI